MELRKLLEGVEIKKITGETLKEIEGIAYHSKQIEKGFLFAAIRGIEVDGHQFIEEAIATCLRAMSLWTRAGVRRVSVWWTWRAWIDGRDFRLGDGRATWRRST